MFTDNTQVKRAYPLLEKVRGRNLQNLRPRQEDLTGRLGGRRRRSKSPAFGLLDRLRAQIKCSEVTTESDGTFGFSIQPEREDKTDGGYTLDDVDAELDDQDVFVEAIKSGSGTTNERHSLTPGAPDTTADAQTLDLSLKAKFEEIENMAMTLFPKGVHFPRNSDGKLQKEPSYKLRAKMMTIGLRESSTTPSEDSDETVADSDDQVHQQQQPYRRMRRSSMSRPRHLESISSGDSSSLYTLVNSGPGSEGRSPNVSTSSSLTRVNRFDLSRSQSASRIILSSATKKWHLPGDLSHQPLSPVQDLSCSMECMTITVDDDEILDFGDLPADDNDLNNSDYDNIDIELLSDQYWKIKSRNEYSPVVPSYLNPIRGHTDSGVWLQLNGGRSLSKRYKSYKLRNGTHYLCLINNHLIENAPRHFAKKAFEHKLLK